MSQFLCLPCGYVYTESADEKKPKFDDLPINWSCPECGSFKFDFEKMENKSEN